MNKNTPARLAKTKKSNSTNNIQNEREQHALNIIEHVGNLGSEGIPGFEWPISTNEQQRILNTTAKFKDMTVEEAFVDTYGIREVFGTKKNMENFHAIECKELKPGDVVELKVIAINKKGVIFEQAAYKETIISTVNLYQYPNFKKFIPNEPIKVKVMSKDINKIYVDPLQPMIDEFIEHIQNLVEIQANVKNPITTKVTGLHHMRAGYVGNIRIDNVSDFCGKDMYMQAFIPGSQITLNIESDFEKWDGKDVDTFVTNLAVKPGTTNVTIACSAKEYLRFLGNVNIIRMFGDYCEENDAWKNQTNVSYKGNITGVCRTQNKTGVFVEIPEIGVTGMVPVNRELITSYKPGPCAVRITGFDEPMRFNKEVGQMQHIEPYKIENGILKKINIKCTLKFVDE